MNGNEGTMRELPAEIRPYEKAMALGADKLSDAELLAVLIKTGTRKKKALETAQEMLARYGGLRRMAEQSIARLSETEGIGCVKALTLKCAFELGTRVSREHRIARVQISGVGDLVEMYRAEMNSPKELFRVVMFDIRSRIIKDELVSMGTSDRAPVDPKEVFLPALEHRAATIAVMHNHPAGDPSPSREDFETTARLYRAGQLLGIKLVDHLVFGGNTYYSFFEHGDMLKLAYPEEQDNSGERYRN